MGLEGEVGRQRRQRDSSLARLKLFARLEPFHRLNPLGEKPGWRLEVTYAATKEGSHLIIVEGASVVLALRVPPPVLLARELSVPRRVRMFKGKGVARPGARCLPRGSAAEQPQRTASEEGVDGAIVGAGAGEVRHAV